MISVGIRDGRKGLGFGAGREMEETELEEGEACCFQNDDDSTIDPDVALSYIDEKLQDVLGHFQKDFEGGVSAENLGSKFGGYGSFLPAYQRSPVCSHPRTPPKVHNYNTPRSPNNLHLEGGRHNSVVPSSASLSVRLGPASASATSLPSLRAPSVNDSVKRDECMSSTRAEEFTSKCELMNSAANPSDLKTLKVRIKVGSDNLSTRKNAEIYSGLGLDVSPSSSLDDSPTDSEGLSREPQDALDESPTSILQIMTSFPVHGGFLLSPLPDDLICLTEKEKLRGESRSGLMHNGCQENLNTSDSARSYGKVLGDKKTKSFEGIGALLKKETDIDTLACEELVSNALKLPLLSNSYCNVIDTAKATAREADVSVAANKGVVKDEYFSDLAKDEPLKPVSPQDIGRIEKPNEKAGSAGKVWEDKKANSHDDFSVYPRKDSNFKGEKGDDFAKADSNVSKGRKAQNAELMDPSKQKASQNAMSHEEDGMKLPPVKEHSSSGGKKKSKGSQSHGAQGAEVPKESLRSDSSLVPKNKKSTHANNYLSKSEVEDFKLQKDYGKARDRYRDFFGDIGLEQGDNDVDSVEMPSADRLKDSEVVGKGTFAFNSTPKERFYAKKIDKLSTSEAYPKMALNAAPFTGNGPSSDAPGTVAPLVKEDWVCCDKCQKWRLLPLGTNPDSLPEKWLCSMLNWLPGMNRCSISEEETTKALTTVYQVPAPESQNNLHVRPGGVVSGVTSSDAHHFDQNHQNHGSHAVPSGGKKKQGLKEVSNATNQDGPTQFPNSMKKNLQASTKSRSLNGVDQSPPVNELDLQNLSKSSSIIVEKHRHKQKEKNKLLEHYSDGGDTKSSKMKSERETDQDSFRASKKIKMNGTHCSDEDWMSDHSGAVAKVGPCSSSGVPINVLGKDRRKNSDRSSSRDSKCDAKNSLQAPVRNPKDKVQFTSDDGSLHMGKCDDKDIIARKRKVNEFQDTPDYAASLPSAGNHLHDSRDFVEETSENDHRKDKKARVSKSEGKETSASRGSGGTTKKGRSIKDQQLGLDLGCALSQRDLGSVQPSVAATSSSSKVSGSHKNKANLQEVKGSPVESVSSSPLRISNPDKSTSTRRNLLRKDDFQDAGFFATGTPRRCSDGENDGGRNCSGTILKDETFTVTHHGSVESSVLDFQDRDMGHLSGSKAKVQIVHSPEFANHHFTNGGTDTLGHGTQYPCKPQTLDQCLNEERGSDSQYHANASRPRKTGKGSSSRSKDKNGSFKSEFDKGKIKTPDSFNESIDHTPYEEKSRTGKNRVEEKFGVNSDKVEKNSVGKKDSAGKTIESSKRESQSKFGRHDALDVKADEKQNLLLDRDGERTSKRFLSDKTDREVFGRGKSHPLPPSGRGQNETGLRCPQLNPGSQKENGANSLSIDASEGDEALKAPKQIKKAENQNGTQPINSRHPTPSGHKVRDVDAPSPVRKDSSSQAATNAVKEAKDLKHLADRLKNSGSNLESTGLYFQAALKFLHGAALLESCNSESAKHGEMIQSMQMYSSTAKLCEFCAHEYEKSKDMATAALAYKCMEVAYMRVIYSSHTSASRDRHELQTALQIAPPGESPSSSASDVDNLNNPVTVDKGALAKGVSSPQVAGIAARNRSSFVRLLNFAHNVNFAMEASRKSRIAFAAANQRLEEAQRRDGITSIKRALDFNFQDVEGLLRLVRLAMEASP